MARKPQHYQSNTDKKSYHFFSSWQRVRSIQPKFWPVRPGKGVHLKRWTGFFETFSIGPNRSIEFWIACSKRSDSGKQCEVKKAMKSGTAPHYLNASKACNPLTIFDRNGTRTWNAEMLECGKGGMSERRNTKTRNTHLLRTRSIQPKFPEISVQNSMDRFGPTEKVSKKRVHLLRWTTFPGRTGWNFGWMDRAVKPGTHEKEIN